MLNLDVCPGTVSDGFALQIIQRGKDGHHTVAIVIGGLRADSALSAAADLAGCAAESGSGFFRHTRAALPARED